MRSSLLAFLLIGLFLIPALSVHAQGGPLVCENYNTFPSSPWAVDNGDPTVGTNGGYVRNVLVVPGGSDPNYFYIKVHFDFPPRVVYTLTYNVYFANATLSEVANLTTALILNSSNAGSVHTLQPPTGNWITVQHLFYPAGNRADHVEVSMRNPDPDMALQVAQMCWLDIPPTPTTTLTPSPTHTTAPTTTPTPSNTAVPTSTPTGTLPDTATPAPDTSTPTTAPDTQTPIPSTLSSGNFPSPIPPRACQDVFNPCGALPFGVPNFAPISLASPGAITAVAYAGTATLSAFTSPTPGGALSTGTASTAENGVYEMATNIAGVANGIIANPTLVDAGGGSIDIANSANQIGSNIGGFFGVAKALQAFFLGKTGNLIAFLILILALMLFIKLLTFALPILKAIATFIFNIIKMVPFLG